MSPALIQELDEEPASPPVQITLNEVESTMRNLLLDVVDYIHARPSSHITSTADELQIPDDFHVPDEPTVLRFTGGWVRDKLLGKPSHDIDVAINNMTGLQFGLLLREYLLIPGNPEKYGLEGVATTESQDQKAGVNDKSKTVGGLHKIEANPEKSKHLETVTTRVLGLDIDLVNLRKETYSEDSRNPQMEFGTPEEDALRRDATVNAMFYNLNTRQVEDFTGQGLSDMQKNILRTPLEPYQTFKDDPLRVLRLIRFASRLGWAIEATAMQAMSRPDIKDALQRKISRERVGAELEKALRGPSPHEALRLIYKLDLYDVIFCDPVAGQDETEKPDLQNWQQTIDSLRDILQAGDAIAQISIQSAEEEYQAWTLAAFVPYRHAPIQTPTNAKKWLPLPVRVAREGIKANNKISDLISLSFRNMQEIQTLADVIYRRKRNPKDLNGTPDDTTRAALGMRIRVWGPTWRSQVLFALMTEISENPDQEEVICRRYIALLEHIRDLAILDAYQFKPVLDGKQLAKALDIRPGPWMRDALDVVMSWQLTHPDHEDTEGALEEVRRHGELAFLLAENFLKLTIRPLFAKSRPRNVTAQGRKQTTSAPLQAPELADDNHIKPWKSPENAIALQLLRWSVSSLDEQQVEVLWPSIIPPVLALLDDWDPKYKTLGSDLLLQLLERTSADLLRRTGLAPVFEEALMPCLTFLPTITEASESTVLLSSVYRALLQLGRAAHPGPQRRESQTSFLAAEHSKMLDDIIRKGVLYGYTHASQYPKILAITFTALAELVCELGIESTKHLKFVVPMLVDHLSYPLITADVQSHIQAARASQAVIQNAWPRIDDYAFEMLKGWTFCWTKIYERQDDGAGILRRDLRKCVKVLKTALAEKAGFKDDLQSLVAADNRLKELLLPDQG